MVSRALKSEEVSRLHACGVLGAMQALWMRPTQLPSEGVGSEPATEPIP